MWKKKVKIETILGPETKFEGVISSKGIIRIDGFLDGGIADAEEVIVGETGTIKGDIEAKTIVVAGKVIGNITALDSIEMLPTCQVNGDIKTAHVSIHKGVIFEGNCHMTREKTEVINIKKGRGK
ncbi:MAG TPA: polymer-forming cytoskeletal family protein [Syntrophaceae bacterium]|nr:polymer-forming cytoskeletal family protein [Syntrophaceae bacterium]